jgi:homoserine dehydrogenase
VGWVFCLGAGAGAGPTASAVVGDLIDVARGLAGPVFGVPAAALAALPKADPAERRGRYYLRLTAADRPGVLAEITRALGDAGVSIESLIQRGHAASGDALVVVVTHEAREADIQSALGRIGASDAVTAPPVLMHILDL